LVQAGKIMSKTVFIIYNPRSGNQRAKKAEVANFSSLLNGLGFEVEVRETLEPNHATTLSREAVDRKFDLVVAHGGDGTMNEVLQGMVGSRTPLVVWPGGTANVVALDLNLPRRPSEIVEMIAQDNRKRVTIGKAGLRYFFFTAGIGLDAEVITAVNAQLKKHIGKGAFWIAGFSHLVKWQPTDITFKIDDKVYEGTFAVIGNSYGYGGTLSLTPFARMDDEMLDICIFSGKSKIQYINYLVACLNKDQIGRDGVTYLKTRRIEANSIKPLPIQVDGELIGFLPMVFEAVPDALTLIVPPDTFRN
jgi:diacylglycerol kinase (ATP)